MLDHPHWCSVLLLLVVAMHWLLASRYPNADLLRPLDQSAIKGQVAELYISVTGVSALAAGFAGVVIVFGLQSESSRFRRFRWAGGRRLIGNWMAVIGAPIAANFLSLAATVGVDVNKPTLARWLFEASIVLLLHTSLRVLWLLRALAKVVAADDNQEERNSKRVSTDVFFGQPST